MDSWNKFKEMISNHMPPTHNQTWILDRFSINTHISPTLTELTRVADISCAVLFNMLIHALPHFAVLPQIKHALKSKTSEGVVISVPSKEVSYLCYLCLDNVLTNRGRVELFCCKEVKVIRNKMCNHGSAAQITA